MKKSLTTAATMIAVTTEAIAINDTAKADVIECDKGNSIVQNLPDEKQQAQQDVCNAQNKDNEAQVEIDNATSKVKETEKNLADADSKAIKQERISNASDVAVNDAEAEVDAAQKKLDEYNQVYQKILTVPVFYLNTAMNSSAPLVFDLAHYDGYKGQNAEAEKNFRIGDYQANIELLKAVIKRNQDFVNDGYKRTTAYYNLSSRQHEIDTINKEIDELNQIIAEMKNGTFDVFNHYHDWISKDRGRYWYNLQSASVNDVQNIIKQHQKILQEDQSEITESSVISKKELEAGNYYLAASRDLLPKLEEATNNIIKTQETLTTAKHKLENAKRTARQNNTLLVQIEGKRANAQSATIKAQGKLLQALLRKNQTQKEVFNAKEKLPVQTDAVKYSPLIHLESLTVDAGDSIPTPKVTTAVAVDNGKKDRAIITLPGDVKENSLPKDTKVVWKDEAKVTNDLQKQGMYLEDVLIVFPDGSVILTNGQVKVMDNDAKKTQEVSDTVKSNDSETELLVEGTKKKTDAQQIDNDELSKSADSEIENTKSIMNAQRKNVSAVQSKASVKDNSSLIQPLISSKELPYQESTQSNNMLPKTGNNSVIAITALGVFSGLIGIGALLKKY